MKDFYSIYHTRAFLSNILDKFILNGYIGNNDGHLYFIGKNPLLQKFTWSLIL